MQSQTKRNPRLYSPAIAAAFREQTKQRTRWWSQERRFLNLVARVLEGGPLPRRLSRDATIEVDADYVLLAKSRTEQYWPLVRAVCIAVPLRCGETEWSYLAIRPPQQP